MLFSTISNLATFNLNTKEIKPLKSPKTKSKRQSTSKLLPIFSTSNYHWDHIDARTRKMDPLYSSPVLWGIPLLLTGGKKIWLTKSILDKKSLTPSFCTMIRCMPSLKFHILLFMITEASNFTNLTNLWGFSTFLFTFYSRLMIKESSNTMIQQLVKSLPITLPEIHTLSWGKTDQMQSLPWEVQRALLNGGLQVMEYQESSYLLAHQSPTLDSTKGTWWLHLKI